MTMNDLFTSDRLGELCVHIATETLCIIRDAVWFKGELHYSVLVPMRNEKGEMIFCGATYSESEIEIIN